MAKTKVLIKFILYRVTNEQKSTHVNHSKSKVIVVVARNDSNLLKEIDMVEA